MLLRTFIFLAAWQLAQPTLASQVDITDISGRSVTLEKPVERFVVSEGRYVLTLGLLLPDHPIQGLVGMMQPVSWTYPDLEKQLKARYPEFSEVAIFGGQDQSSVSVEKIIDLKPEVAIFGIQDHGPGAKNAELLNQLEAAGIKVVFIDFRMDPLQNTIPSLEILGKLFNAESQLSGYLEYYRQQKALIQQRVSKVEQRPRVFIQAHPGRFECCVGMADGMLGPFVEFAGGINIADAVAPGPTSRHTMEFLLIENPDIWIGTASGTPEDVSSGKNIVALGAGLSRDQARQSLNRFLSDASFQALDAVKQQHAYAIWHDFYNSPLNIVALQAFAKWLHPGEFQDTDPNQSLQYIFQHYLPFEWKGTAIIGNSL
ncbi:ABC transporter substrate-binding protein [Hahella ganghwensis]|uniref:ABC transporter substrate-binding protein n=1 Tax=Hahella ganghwensis TaxID=286420 RepID=UPI00035D2A93|nr:ABC transporter substrate-binding protein [Hahella ganghwensis]